MVDMARFERDALYGRSLEDVQTEARALEEGVEEMAMLMRGAGINPYADPDYLEIRRARDILREAMRKRTEAAGRAQKREPLSLEGAV